jgi:raffinose/stachyose/melibiose transport system substrate-binding protein
VKKYKFGGKIMKNHFSKVWIMLLLLFLILTGCVPAKETTEEESGSKKDENVTLKVMFMEQSAAKALESLANKFTKENPTIKIEYQFTPNSQYKGVIRPQLLSGEGPDLFMVYYDLASFTDDLSKEPWVENMLPAVKDAITINGKLIEMPMTAAGYAVFYNKEIFEKLNLAVPTTYEEFLSVAEKIKQAGITPLAMGMKDGFVPNSAITQLLGTFYAEKGDNYYKDLYEGKEKIAENDHFKAGINQFVELNKKGYFSKGVLSGGYQEVYQEIAQGKAAMILQGTWLPGFTGSMNPDLKLGSFILPNPSGKTTVQIFPDWNFGVNKNSKNKEAAKKFLNFVAQPENMGYLDKEWTSVPAFKNVTVDLGESMVGYLEGLQKLDSTIPWYPLVSDPNYEFIKLLTSNMSGQLDADEMFAKYDDVLIQNKSSMDAIYK